MRGMYNRVKSEMGVGLTEACILMAMIALIAVVALPKIGSAASEILRCDAGHRGIGSNPDFEDGEDFLENCVPYTCDEQFPFNC